jgi:hypothetical protein
MTNAGIFGEIQIVGNWAQKRMIMPVLMATQEQTTLSHPSICPIVPFNKIKGTIPTLGDVPVASQLREFEHAVAGTGKAGSFDIEVLKDRVILPVSDEAMIESDVGNPMTLQQSASSLALAADLNRQIAAQLNTTPQIYGATGDLGNWTSTKPTLALGKIVSEMGVHRPTAFVMGTLAAEYYIDAVGDKAAVANLSEWGNAVSMHPSLRIPIFASTDIDKLDDTSGNRYVFGVCARTPGVFQVVSTIKARTYDDPRAGAQVNQYDIWRSAFSNILQVSNKNQGVMWGYMRES